MRKALVAGNWKMNGTQAMAAELCQEIANGMSQLGDVEVLVCPPAILISTAADALQSSEVGVGGQDLDVNAGGAFTGQTSAAMLLDAERAIRRECNREQHPSILPYQGAAPLAPTPPRPGPFRRTDGLRWTRQEHPSRRCSSPGP